MKLLFEIDKKNYDITQINKAFRRPSARAIIFRDNKLAVIYSKKYDYYKIPGGGVEPGEENTVAMIREVKEEAGLTVIPETIKEFGYVHRIEKGHPEPIFIQDNFYYLCEVEPGQENPAYEEDEIEDGYVPAWVELSEAIKVNETFQKNNPQDSMINRELRVLKIVEETLK